jgi:ParB family chromosome partitioning protein
MTEQNLQERKLGRGLSALLGENKSKINSNIISFGGENIEKISVDKIVAGIYQPRQNFSESEITELAESIKEKGLIQPILLRKKGDEDIYEIIAGERRFRASKLAGLQEVSAIVRKINNHDALEIALIENIQREDLSVIEEARGYKKLIEEFSYLQEMIAKKVGKSRSHIANLLRLLNLPDEVQEFLDKKLLSMGHARAIINSDNPEELAKKIVLDSLTVRETEDIVRDEKIKNVPLLYRTESKIKYVNPQSFIEFENKLSNLIGAPIKISYNGNSGSGKITIIFNDFDLISDLLVRLEN